MPFKRLTHIGLTSIWFGAAAQLHPAEAKPLATSEECNAVGRVVKVVNSQLPEGQSLCLGDSIRITPNKQLKFACYASGQEVTLLPGTMKIADYCGAVSHRYRRCTRQITVNCIHGRNPNISVYATLFVPYSSTIIGGRPYLLWESEPTAERYTIELLLRNKLLWKKTVQGNSMPYPDVQPLEQGKAYVIRVTALRGNQKISQNTSILNRISAQKVTMLQSTIASIDALSISELKKTKDMEQIYLGQGLLSESIGILKAHLRVHQHNPSLHRLVGDRLMNAGLPKEAQPYFQKAEVLAQRQRDRQELAKAKAGLAEIAALPRLQPASNQ